LTFCFLSKRNNKSPLLSHQTSCFLAERKKKNSMSAKATLQNRRALIWWGNLAFVVFWIVFAGYAITATSFEHTYQKPPGSPGTLHTDRWSRDFFFVGSLVLLILVPMTSAFMSDNPTARSREECCRGMFWRQLIHIFTVVILWVYFMVVMGFWARDYAIANNGSAANQFNRANDDRWCCVYYGIASAGTCDNTSVCPGMSAADLVTNPLFLWRFWWLVIFIIFLVIDFAYTVAWFRIAVYNYLDELEERNNPTTDPEQPPQQPVNALARNRVRVPPSTRGYKPRQ
jgi:hypothetical protein